MHCESRGANVILSGSCLQNSKRSLPTVLGFSSQAQPLGWYWGEQERGKRDRIRLHSSTANPTPVLPHSHPLPSPETNCSSCSFHHPPSPPTHLARVDAGLTVWLPSIALVVSLRLLTVSLSMIALHNTCYIQMLLSGS